MMVAVYVTSIERYVGKDLITMGLMDRLRRDGFKVGYFKPIGHSLLKGDDAVADKSARLIQSLFELEDSIEHICPVVITQELVGQNYEQDVTGLREKIEGAFKKVSEQKDLVLIGSDNNFSEGSSFGLSGSRLISLFNAYPLFVERYERDFCIDFLLELRNVIGTSMMGVVFNKVGAADMEEIKESVSSFLRRKEIDVFGSLPGDTLLGSTGVKDLVDHLGADVVCCRHKLDGLVENFLVGGMQVDKFITYLVKSPSAAIIVGGDRTDIQLVAIENGVECLILSGSLYPNKTITARAKAQGVPVVVVQDDTYTVAKNVDAIAGRLSLLDTRKIEHGIKLVDQEFDFERFYKKLDLRPTV